MELHSGSHKGNHSLTVWPNHSPPRHLLKGSENIRSHKDLNGNHSSHFIHNRKPLETGQTSFSRQINKGWPTHKTERSSGIKREGSLIHATVWRNLKSIMQSERSQIHKPYSMYFLLCGTFSSVQSLSRVWLFVTPWTAACQASLSITNFWSLLKLMSVESVMPSNPLILSGPLLLPPSSFPSITVFSNESVLHIRWHFRKGQTGFPGGSVVKKLPASVKDRGSILIGKDGCMASPTHWTWVWMNSRSWRWTGRSGMLQSMGSQRVRHDWATELNWDESHRAIPRVNIRSRQWGEPLTMVQMRFHQCWGWKLSGRSPALPTASTQLRRPFLLLEGEECFSIRGTFPNWHEGWSSNLGGKLWLHFQIICQQDALHSLAPHTAKCFTSTSS